MKLEFLHQVVGAEVCVRIGSAVAKLLKIGIYGQKIRKVGGDILRIGFQGILMVGERIFGVFTELVVLLLDGIDCKAADKKQVRQMSHR